jgi:hypothetical protein
MLAGAVANLGISLLSAGAISFGIRGGWQPSVLVLFLTVLASAFIASALVTFVSSRARPVEPAIGIAVAAAVTQWGRGGQIFNAPSLVSNGLLFITAFGGAKLGARVRRLTRPGTVAAEQLEARRLSLFAAYQRWGGASEYRRPVEENAILRFGFVRRLLRPKWAGVWRILGYLFMAVAFVMWGVHQGAMDWQTGGFLAPTLIGGLTAGFAFLLAGAAQRFYKVSRGLVAPSAPALLARDERPPVVYLRRFDIDRLTSLVKETPGIPIMVEMHTEEEDLTKCLGLIGPVVEVRRPNETVPQPGAARMAFGDTEWQAGVLALIQRAALVVIRPDTSRGVEWELETAIQNVEPQRLVLLLPDDEITLSMVRQQLDSLLPGALATLELHAPRGGFLASFFRWVLTISTNKISQIEGLRGVLYFDPHWLPHFRPAGSPTTRRRVLGGRAGRFENLLAPVLDRLEPPRPVESALRRAISFLRRPLW